MVFVRDGEISIIALYIDDITIAARSLSSINEDKAVLQQHYELTDMGDITWIQGIHVTRDRSAWWIALSQLKYANEILERFCKSDMHPHVPERALSLVKLTSPEVNVKLYQAAVGVLMYVMLGTRPDLAYTIATLGWHAAHPAATHVHAMDRALRYLRATKDHRLVFQRANGNTLHGYVDVDWASDVNDRKSTSSFIFLLVGGAIS
jgi:hypothetical protein